VVEGCGLRAGRRIVCEGLRLADGTCVGVVEEGLHGDAAEAGGAASGEQRGSVADDPGAEVDGCPRGKGLAAPHTDSASALPRGEHTRDGEQHERIDKIVGGMLLTCAHGALVPLRPDSVDERPS